MKVIVYTKHIVENIEKAQTLVNVPVSLMFKNFYEDIYEHISDRISNKIFGLHLNNSVCYSIGKAEKYNTGAVVTSFAEALRCMQINAPHRVGIRELYIPINANDDREGLSIYEAGKLSDDITSIAGRHDINICGMITSGCLNEKHPEIVKLHHIWEKLNHCLNAISLGGSFWLGTNEKLPDFISDVRIGEYMLFGTIPYCDKKDRLGSNGIELEANVIGIYPERSQLILDCGYSMADLDKCKQIVKDGLQFVDSSSEYAIMQCNHVSDYRIGDVVRFIPNYKSLVKLRYAEHEYR